MKFEELEARMRAFEAVRDDRALPGVYLAVRLDGRGFTRLTKEAMDFERPFDVRFRDHMIAAVEHLMGCGPSVVFGYTHSDEISLLLGPEEGSFGRSLRKLQSVLAGEASGVLSLRMGTVAAVDCRVVELPTEEHVVDYFRWRNEDAHRNALNGWCYWTLRGEGRTAAEATKVIEGAPIAEKNELLFQRGINFNEVSAWQRRGVAVVWEEFEKEAVSPVTGARGVAVRRRLKTVVELPMREEFSAFVRGLIAGRGA